jgi:hypothetical protein
VHADRVRRALPRLFSLDHWWEVLSLPQTVRLSLDFSFLYRKAGSCRGVRGPAVNIDQPAFVFR